MRVRVAFEDRAERRLIKRLRAATRRRCVSCTALHGRTTFGFLLRLLADRAAAEDVQQQVFLEAWQHGDRYDPARGNLLAWLLTIARSRAIDHIRRRVPEPRDPASTVALADGAEGNKIDELLEHWRLVGVLDQLPPEEADLLRRRFYLEQSQSEIAEKTGLPLGTVKTRMTRALNRMRDLLEAET